jgi:hypothetical protein
VASIAVSGQLLRNPSPANVMANLHYVLGLKLLGHEVLYVEERGWLDRCREPGSERRSGVPGAALSMVRELLSRMRVDVPVVWVDAERGLVEGLLWSQLRERLRKTDLMLEVGEPCALEERAFATRRAFVDVDPVVTELSGFAGHGYDAHFTYGVNPGCRASLPAAPSGAVEWLPTLPPVVPRLWRAPRPCPGAPLRARLTAAPPGTVEHGAVWLDCEGGDFAKLRELPAHVQAGLELALPEGADTIREDLRAAGWKVRALEQVESSLAAYHGFLTGARAELGTARGPSVLAQDGWVGDRTACTLAAGRPAIVPDTGIARWLAGSRAGLLTYEDAGGAADAIALVTRDPERHQRAAFRLATEVFHFGAVLTHLLERALPRRVDAVA